MMTLKRLGYRRLPLSFLCLAGLLIAPASTAQSSPEPPAKTAAADDPWDLIARALKWAGLDKAPGADAFRGSTALLGYTDLTVWAMARDGTGARQITSGPGYEWPVYAPDSRRIAALKLGKLVIIQGRKTVPVPSEEAEPDPPRVLLAWTDKGIAVLTAARNVVLVDPVTGARQIGPGVSEESIPDLLQSTRTCGGDYIGQVAAPKDSQGRLGRSDIVFYRAMATEGEAAHWRGTFLTKQSKRRTNVEPAFSADCRRILFVAK
jgi:hypothetical protein